MLLGKIVCESAMAEGKFTTYLPCYGAEMRGGTAHCMVCVSDKMIPSPYVDSLDICVAMNEPSFTKFAPKISHAGFMVANSSLVSKASIDSFKDKLKTVCFPMTAIAKELGAVKVANIVALGALLSQRKLVNPKSVEEIIKNKFQQYKDVLSKEILSQNIKALYYFLKEGVGSAGTD